MPDEVNSTAVFSERPRRRRGRRPNSARNLTFAANLKRLRERDDLTQEQLNEALDLAMGTIAKWEQRTHEPSLSQLVQIAAHFGVPPGDLLASQQLPEPVFGLHAPDSAAGIWQRFVLDVLAQYPTSRVEINFWADNQTAYIQPPEAKEPPPV